MNDCSMQVNISKNVHMVKVAMQMVCDVRGTLPLTAPSPHSTCLGNGALMQKCPPLVDAPRLACLDSTLFPGTGGPWRPMEARGAWGWMGDTVIHSCRVVPPQGPGYLRSAPAAQVLFEPAAQLGSLLLQIGSLERCSF